MGYFAAPGGSVMDDKVIETADEANAVYIMTDLRSVEASFFFFFFSFPLSLFIDVFPFSLLQVVHALGFGKGE